MMNELYNQRILKLAAEIPHIGALDASGLSRVVKADAQSRLCGSKVHVELSLADDNTVAAFAHEVEACALGQASSSVMGREIIGASPEELRAVGAQMRAMLKQDGPPPQDSDRGALWSDLEVLEPVREYKNRHASTLLTFDAVEDCLAQLGV